MDTSLFLARFLGLYLIIVIPAVLFNRRHLDKVVSDFSNNLGLVYLSGFFHIVLGLIVVLLHNIWVMDWRVLITILGWLGIFKGLIRFYFPEKMLAMTKKFTPQILILFCLVFLFLGIYLVYVGFTF